MKNPDIYVKSGWHWSFGWMRRREMDSEDGYCYEDGDGDLIFTARPDHHLVCYLDVYEDFRTGEKYLCLNPDPIAASVAREKVKRAMGHGNP
jgi:hypothetical protein